MALCNVIDVNDAHIFFLLVNGFVA